jgi:hypothetical protein
MAVSRKGNGEKRKPPTVFFLLCVLLLAVQSNGEECFCDRQGDSVPRVPRPRTLPLQHSRSSSSLYAVSVVAL